MLSQQLADVNQDWVPKWSSDEVKYCIVRNCTRWNFVLETRQPISMESKNSCKVLVSNAEDTTRMVCHH
jgi:hypothetical protein